MTKPTNAERDEVAGLLEQLDEIARDTDSYGFGLPIHSAASMDRMVAVLVPVIRQRDAADPSHRPEKTATGV